MAGEEKEEREQARMGVTEADKYQLACNLCDFAVQSTNLFNRE